MEIVSMLFSLFNSDDFPFGNYGMNMVVTSNDPTTPTLTVPIKMTIKAPDTLKVTALVEGFFNGSTMVADTVTAELRRAITPYALLESKKVFLNTSGFGKANFSSVVEGTPYYIVIKHRNSIETWSAAGQSFGGGILNYDFTTAQSQAYGSNMKLNGTKWCIYNGDVIRDNFIDGSDVAECFNASNLGLSGYVVTDVNGDAFVDGSDVSLAFNNSNLGIGAVYPSKKDLPTKNIEQNRSIIRSDK